MNYPGRTGVRVEHYHWLGTIEISDRLGLNREPWFASKRILEFVGFVVNPVFSVFWDSRWKTVHCPKGQSALG